MNANDYMDALAKTIMETVEKFAPEKRAENNKKPFKETWITNEIKDAIVKRNNLFEKWIQNPAKTNRERYKNARDNVTNLIREEKRNKNFQKLGESPTPKQIYKTLKTIFLLTIFFLSGHFCRKNFRKHLQLSLSKCNQRLCS